MDIFEEIGKTLSDEIKSTGKHIRKQVRSGPADKHAPIRSNKYLFTKNFYTKAAEWGLSEADAIDVYDNADKKENNIIIKKYTNYELGIEWSADSVTGLPVIDDIWKKND